MDERKDSLVARIAVERGYVTDEQIAEALANQRTMKEQMSIEEDLLHILARKRWLTPDQARDIENRAAMQTGEARRIGGYEVVAKLGQGGMGAVYRARKLDTGQSVALKILPPSMADAETVARFKRESLLVQKLNHDRIVGFVEFGYDEQRRCYFCALELIEGEDLATRLERLGPLPEEEAVSCAIDIAGALQHAYMNGLVHRDVKPANIMVTSDGAKLLDLGLARPSNTADMHFTQSGTFVGSLCYASPEQVRGETDVDTRSDIYSLGATLYSVLTGRLPFDGGSVAEIIQKHVSEKLDWPAEVNPGVSEGLCRVVAKMMADSPDDRYQTPQDAARDLALVRDGDDPHVEPAVLRASSVALPPGGAPVRVARPQGRSAPVTVRRRSAAERGGRSASRAAQLERTKAGPGGLPPAAKIALPVAGVVSLVIILVALVGGGDGDDEGRTVRTPPAAPAARAAPATPLRAEAEPPAGPPPAAAPAPEAAPVDDEFFARLRRESEARMASGDAGAPTPAAGIEPGTKAVSFQDGAAPGHGYAGTADTYLSEDQPDSAHGSAGVLLMDGDEPPGSGKACAILVRWDVSAVPRGSKVRSARIMLNCVNASRQPYEVRAMRRAWVEGEASWHGPAAGEAWQSPGARGDRDRGDVMGVVMAGAVGGLTVELGPEGVAVVQSWIDDASVNRGIQISSAKSSDGADLSSRESAEPSLRPKLTVAYRPTAAE